MFSERHLCQYFLAELVSFVLMFDPLVVSVRLNSRISNGVMHGYGVIEDQSIGLITHGMQLSKYHTAVEASAAWGHERIQGGSGGLFRRLLAQIPCLTE